MTVHATPVPLPFTTADLDHGRDSLRATNMVHSDSIPTSTTIRHKIEAGIERYNKTSTAHGKKLADQLPDSARSRLVAAPSATMHRRHPGLNQIPLFYAAFETEIASADALEELSQSEKDFHAIRMVGKRFIDTRTGTSLFTDTPVGKSNPELPLQNSLVRDIRGEAATATFDRYGQQYVKDLYASVCTSLAASGSATEKTTVHLVRPGRSIYAHDSTVNFLSLVTQAELTSALNQEAALHAKQEKREATIEFSGVKQAIVISRTARSNASPIGRLVQQGYFDMSEIKPGDKIIIADDHTQAGSTLLTMAAALEEAGAQVLAAVTPTTHPFCAQLSMSESVRTLLHQTLQCWDTEGKVQGQLAVMGMSPETLTDHEAMILIAYATDPTNPTAMAAFRHVESELNDGHGVMEGEADSLKPILNSTPLNPDQIVQEMLHESATTRKLVAPTPIEDVHVLDWDDFLRDEKGMNYQLMHNALAVSAHRYQQTHPLLRDLADAVSAARGKPYDESMPKLSMGVDDYARFAIANPDFVKRDMVDDLLKKAAGIDTALARALHDAGAAEVGKLRNILNAEFRRQYKKLVAPSVDRTLLRQYPAPTSQAAPALPFPDVRLQLMPGARAFLDKHRVASARLVLISNRQDGDMQNEINKLRIAHYFDSTSGVPNLTDREEIQRAFSKPNPGRLQEALQKLPGASHARLTLWGDTPKDILQADGIAHQGEIHGVLVNPAREMFDGMQGKTTIPVRHYSALTDAH
ncbi:MAG: HAD hydrolase-like protein [Herminiimonas sp.]|nr:HAD hydrolase-like protein [Herminiimonas sp.]